MLPIVHFQPGYGPSAGTINRVTDVRYWHKADMLNALTNVCFGGKEDIDQPPLTSLD